MFQKKFQYLHLPYYGRVFLFEEERSHQDVLIM